MFHEDFVRCLRLIAVGLDSNLKMWRFYADILNDMAVSFDLIAPFFKDLLLPITCVSNLCRSIVGVAGGSTRAALTQHQAIAHNMGDVSAKDGSQETLVNLMALVVNLFLLHTIKRDRLLVWSLYFLLTTLHLYANYRAIRTLQLRTWNWNRFVLLCENFFRSGEIRSIEWINAREPILFEVRQKIQCHVGIRLRSEQSESLEIHRLIRDRFAVAFDHRKKSFEVILMENCTDNDSIRCYFLLQYLIHSNQIEQYCIPSTNISWLDIDRLHVRTTSLYQEFLYKAEQVGWDVHQAKFLTSSYRYSSKSN